MGFFILKISVMTAKELTKTEMSPQFTGYYYRDNWSGLKRKFNSLSEAMLAASKEYGNSIAICFEHNGELAILVNASGFVPAPTVVAGSNYSNDSDLPF